MKMKTAFLILLICLIELGQLASIMEDKSKFLKSRKLKKKKKHTNQKTQKDGKGTDSNTQIIKQNVYVGPPLKYGDGAALATDLNAIGTNLNKVAENGRKLLQQRNVYTTTKVQDITSKAMTTLNMVNAGLIATQKTATMIRKLDKNSEAILACLGPIGLGISLGLNIISMGTRAYNGEPLIPPSDKEVLLGAIAETNQKLDSISQHMDYQFDQMQNLIKISTLQTQYFQTVEVMRFAYEQYQKMERSCLQQDQNFGMTDEEILKQELQSSLQEKFMSQQQIKQRQIENERMKNVNLKFNCEVAQRKFYEDLKNSNFVFHYDLFLRFFSGESSLLGGDYFETLLEQSRQDFDRYNTQYTMMLGNAIEATIVLQTFNTLQHKFMVHDQLMYLNQKEQMGTNDDKDSFELEFVAIAAMSECKQCVQVDEKYLEFFSQAKIRHEKILGIQAKNNRGKNTNYDSLPVAQQDQIDLNNYNIINQHAKQLVQFMDNQILKYPNDAHLQAPIILLNLQKTQSSSALNNDYQFLLTIEKSTEFLNVFRSQIQGAYKSAKKSKHGFRAYYKYMQNDNQEIVEADNIWTSGGIIYGYKVNGKSGKYNWQIRVMRRTFSFSRQYQMDTAVHSAFRNFNIWYFKNGEFPLLTCDKILKHATEQANDINYDIVCESRNKGENWGDSPGSFTYVPQVERTITCNPNVRNQFDHGQGVRDQFMPVYGGQDQTPYFYEHFKDSYDQGLIQAMREFEGKEGVFTKNRQNKKQFYWIKKIEYQCGSDQIDSYQEYELEFPIVGSIDKDQDFLPKAGNENNKKFRIGIMQANQENHIFTQKQLNKEVNNRNNNNNNNNRNNNYNNNGNNNNNNRNNNYNNNGNNNNNRKIFV